MSLSSAAFLLIALPALPLVAGLLARRQTPATAGRIAWFAAAAATGLALLGAVLLLRAGPQTFRWAPFGPDSACALALRMDALSMIMAALDNALNGRAMQRWFAQDPASWAAHLYLSSETMSLR